MGTPIPVGATLQPMQAVPIPDGATLQPVQSAAPLTESDAASGAFANQQAQQKVSDVAGPPTHILRGGKIVPIGDPQPTGVMAGVKRNTVDAITGIYHAFHDPATEQEKQELRAKFQQSAKSAGQQVPEAMIDNPPKAMLALHRILDAPADLLKKKGLDEVGVAQDLINNHQYWRGGNMYLSGLADRALAEVPLVGPAVNSIAERAESGDVSGAATDIGAAMALENAGAIGKAGGKVVGKAAELAGKVPGKVGEALSDSEILDRFKTRTETPAAQHGTPVPVESPLDGPTVGKQLGGKDLSQEALDKLQEHAGSTIPVGGSAKNSLMKAVEPTVRTINETASKMNDAVKDAPRFTTSVMQDNVFGDAKFTDEIESLKKNIPPSVREGLSADVDDVMKDADKALNSNDPQEVLEYRRQLGKQIDWDDIQKNPTTPKEVQNAARAKVYRAIGDKIHAEVPETVELDKTLQPNLELRSHMISKLGDRVVDDPLAAKSEAQSEFKKGKETVDNANHNERAERYRKNLGIGLGLGAAGGLTIEGVKKLFGL